MFRYTLSALKIYSNRDVNCRFSNIYNSRYVYLKIFNTVSIYRNSANITYRNRNVQN